MASSEKNFSIEVDVEPKAAGLQKKLNALTEGKTLNFEINTKSLDAAISRLKNTMNDVAGGISKPTQKAFKNMEKSIKSYLEDVRSLNNAINLATKDLFMQTGMSNTAKTVEDYAARIQGAEKVVQEAQEKSAKAQEDYTARYAAEVEKRKQLMKEQMKDVLKLNKEQKEYLDDELTDIFDSEMEGAGEQQIAFAKFFGGKDTKSGKRGIQNKLDELVSFIDGFSETAKNIPASVTDSVKNISDLINSITEIFVDDETDPETDAIWNFSIDLSQYANDLRKSFESLSKAPEAWEQERFLKAVLSIKQVFGAKLFDEKKIERDVEESLASKKEELDGLKQYADLAEKQLAELKQQSKESSVGLVEAASQDGGDYLKAQLDKFKQMLEAQQGISTEIRSNTITAFEELKTAIEPVTEEINKALKGTTDVSARVKSAKEGLAQANDVAAIMNGKDAAKAGLAENQLQRVLGYVQDFLNKIKTLTSTNKEHETKLQVLAAQQEKFNNAVNGSNPEKLKAIAENLEGFSRALVQADQLIQMASSAVAAVKNGVVDKKQIADIKAKADESAKTTKTAAASVKAVVKQFEGISKEAAKFDQGSVEAIINAGNDIVLIFETYSDVAQKVKTILTGMEKDAGISDAGKKVTKTKTVKLVDESKLEQGKTSIEAYATAIGDLVNEIDKFHEKTAELIGDLEGQWRKFETAAANLERYNRALSSKIKIEKAANYNGVSTKNQTITNSALIATADSLGKMQAAMSDMSKKDAAALGARLADLNARWTEFANEPGKSVGDFVKIREEVALLNTEIAKSTKKYQEQKATRKAAAEERKRAAEEEAKAQAEALKKEEESRRKAAEAAAREQKREQQKAAETERKRIEAEQKRAESERLKNMTPAGNISTLAGDIGKMEVALKEISDEAARTPFEERIRALNEEFAKFNADSDRPIVAFAKLKTEAAALNVEINQTIKSLKEQATAADKAAKETEKQQTSSEEVKELANGSIKNANRIEERINKLIARRGEEGGLADRGLETEKVDELYKKIAEQLTVVIEKRDQLQRVMADGGSDESITKANDDLREMGSVLSKLEVEFSKLNDRILQETQNGVAEAASDFVQMNGWINDLQNALSGFKGGKSEAAKYEEDLKVFRAVQTELQNFKESDGQDGVSAAVERINTALQNLGVVLNGKQVSVKSFKEAMQLLNVVCRDNIQSMREFNVTFKNSKEISAQQRNIKALILQIERYLAVNKRVAESDVGDKMRALARDLRSVQDSSERIDFTNLQKQFADLRISAQEMGLVGETVFQRFQRIFGNKISSYISSIGINMIRRSLREVYNNVIEIDSAMGQLQIVTHANVYEMQQYKNEAAAAAKEVGASVSSVLDSSTTYARLGLNDPVNLAKYTAMYANTSGSNIGDATTAVTAILKGFDKSEADIEDILSKLVKVGNRLPISAAQLGEGLANAGSALSASGNTLEQSIALLTAANASVQDVSKSSTMLRTISTRLKIC